MTARAAALTCLSCALALLTVVLVVMHIAGYDPRSQPGVRAVLARLRGKDGDR